MNPRARQTQSILIIDDSADDLTLYRRTLQKTREKSYRVTEAVDGEEGQRILEKETPECVLLDYSLPGYNGIEILKQIRSRHPFIPVIMLTGQGNENVAVAAMQEGAQNYICKSAITPEILEHIIGMAIAHCAMEKRIHEQRTSLEVFTHALAHDLREPIRTIRSFVELLALQETFRDKTKAYFQHIENAADRMQMLIDTVFHYTRLDDPTQLAREVCDVDAALKGVMENLDKLIHESGATIQGDESLPEVYANRAQLMQVLQNLIGNAINHSEKAVTVHIHAEEQAEFWVFSVKDDGPGIEKTNFQKIFEPFKRLSHRHGNGAGLGLATCKKIVESHGGRIWCESQPGEGTTFLFTLPKALSDVADKDVATTAPIVSDVPAGYTERPLANVLLVDDSRADIEITRHRLIDVPKLRCNFYVVRDGEEALALLGDKVRAGENMDFMLVDINMPEMDGFELLVRMRADKALGHIPVVMCTGSTYDKDMERAKALGAAGYLTKPLAFERLKPIINEAPAIHLSQDNAGYSLLRIA